MTKVLAQYTLTFICLLSLPTLADDEVLTQQICQDAIHSISNINNGRSCASQEPTPTSQKLSFESCTKQNSYYEKSIPPKESLEFKPHPHAVHPACILAAQKRFPTLGYASNCRAGQGLPKTKTFRPCISEEYLSMTYKAFTETTKCFGIPEDQLFPNLALESGFHVNALGSNLDAGISQLTGPLIEGVNKTYFKEYYEKLKSSPACKEILKNFQPLSASPSHRCEAMRPPKSPEQNLIYAAILFDSSKKVIDAGLQNLVKKIPKGVNIEGLRQALTILSFNVAPGSIILALKQFVSSRGANLKASDFKMSNDDPNTFVSYVANHFPVAPKMEIRRRTISIYLPAALNMNQRIEDQMEGGEKCMSPDLKSML